MCWVTWCIPGWACGGGQEDADVERQVFHDSAAGLILYVNAHQASMLGDEGGDERGRGEDGAIVSTLVVATGADAADAATCTVAAAASAAAAVGSVTAGVAATVSTLVTTVASGVVVGAAALAATTSRRGECDCLRGGRRVGRARCTRRCTCRWCNCAKHDCEMARRLPVWRGEPGPGGLSGTCTANPPRGAHAPSNTLARPEIS